MLSTVPVDWPFPDELSLDEIHGNSMVGYAETGARRWSPRST